MGPVMIKSLAVLVALTVAADAQTIQQQMAKCQAMTGALQRLACYDAVNRDSAVPPRAAPAAPPVYAPPAPQPYAPPVTATAPRTAPRQTTADFGAERLQENPAAPVRVSRIVAEVEKFHADPYGRFTVTLSNGQMWKQIEGDVTVASYRKTTRSAIIVRSFLGSYALKFNDSEKMYKVARVQ